jgi:hypothetical protein
LIAAAAAAGIFGISCTGWCSSWWQGVYDLLLLVLVLVLLLLLRRLRLLLLLS